MTSTFDSEEAKRDHKLKRRLREEADAEYEAEGVVAFGVKASHMKVQRKRFLWSTHNIPVGEFVLLSGEAGLGKSTLGLWICARVTRGELPGIHFGTPKAVILDSREDDFNSILLPRFLAMGGDPEYLITPGVLKSGAMATLSFPRDVEHLRGIASEHGAVLYFVDPVTTSLGEGLSQDRSQDVRRGMTPLAAMGRQVGMTVLGMAHHKKGAARATEAISGASAWRDLARAVLTCTRNPDTEEEQYGMLFGITKNNYGPSDTPAVFYATVMEVLSTETEEGVVEDVPALTVVMGPMSSFPAADAVEQNSGTVAELEEATDAKSWLQAFMQSQPGQEATADDVMKAARTGAGYSKSTIYNAKRHLGIRSAQTGYGSDKKSVWRLS